MTDAVLILTDQPTDQDEQVIGSGLADFNATKTGYRDSHPLAALVRDPTTGQPLGGMIGRTSYGMLFIDLVYLPETMRGQAIGSRLLRMMEAEATRRGCLSGVLLTITFQAPSFYERYDWREFGRVPCDPSGTARVFMTKTLASPARSAPPGQPATRPPGGSNDA